MEIAFQDKLLRDICENEDTALSHFDHEIVHLLKRRLADLRSAVNIDELLSGNPRIDPHSSDTLIIDLCNNCRIILCANHITNPLTEDGRIDWSLVTRAKTMRIEKTS